MTGSVGEVLCDAMEVAASFVESPAMAARWNDDSSLNGYSVGALAGHLTSSATAPLRYLDDGVAGEPSQRGAYYARIPAPDEAPDLHAGARARGQAIGEEGPHGVATMLREAAANLRSRLAGCSSDQPITVMGGQVMRLDHYLETRAVEVAVHLDDLADSVGSSVDLPDAAARMAVDHLVAVAVHRHGTTRVLRALTRAERSSEGVFPVL